ncbi:hypothetical protein [Pseudomonas muyukensis]|uniref:Uncharacterized protein n=1 Tax=Pseudomonas muyukensis TaxID=2842357 RepID=A0ABX8M8M2_9PSED|nr:hypothetical protein [Pseudomonas muyukensis]QXH33976.1 hypothetical protein KSS95_17610 [Pseudomonas muyukensis]
MSPNATDNTIFATLLPHAIGATPDLGRPYIMSDGIDKKIITVLVQRQDKQPLTRTELDAIELVDAGNNESLPAALTVTRHAISDSHSSDAPAEQSICFEVTATTPGTWRLAARLRTKQGSIVLNQYAESSGNEQESNCLDIVAKSEADCIKDSDGLEWYPSPHRSFERGYIKTEANHDYGYHQFRLRDGRRIQSVTTLPDLKEKLLRDSYEPWEDRMSRNFCYYIRNDVKTYTSPFQGFAKITFEDNNLLRIIRFVEQTKGKPPRPPFTDIRDAELYMVIIDDKGVRHDVMAKRWDFHPWPEQPETLYKQFTPDQVKAFFEEIEKNLKKCV